MAGKTQTNRSPLGTNANRFSIDKDTLSLTQGKSPRNRVTTVAHSKTGFTCGPDVTISLINVLAHFEKTFNEKFSDSVKDELCSVLAGESLLDAIFKSGSWWDITELYRKGNDWIHMTYRAYGCASKGARRAIKSPLLEIVLRRGCGDTVQVGNQCHYSGSVNYAFFGTACRLCYQHYIKTKKGANRLHAFTPEGMRGLIGMYKPFAENLEASKQWAYAAWKGLLKTKGGIGKLTIKGDRSHCSPVCRKKRTAPFAWHIGNYIGGGRSGEVWEMKLSVKNLKPVLRRVRKL